MLKIILFIIFCLIFVGIATFISNQNKEPKNKSEKPKEDIGHFYYPKKSLLTQTERVFFQELQKQNNNQYAIHSKVRLEDIVGVGKGVGNRYREMRNHIKPRHVDFVITKHSGEILAVIELDDKSHDTERAKVGDEIKNQIFNYNNVKFYRAKVGEDFTHTINNLFTKIKGA